MKHFAQKGISLIELMIAVALGAIVIIGVASSLSSMNLSSNTQVTQNNIQQDSKLVLDFYESQIRKAGATVLDNLAQTQAKYFNLQTNVQTAAGNPTPRSLTVDDFIAGAIAEVDNSLTLIYTSNKYGLNPATDQTFTDGRAFQLNEPLPDRYVDGMNVTFVISDGERVDIFDSQISLTAGQPPTIDPVTPLSKTYKITDSLISPLNFINYSLNTTGAVPRLIETDLTFNRANTIATNVDAVGYVFGIDRVANRDGNVDNYVTHQNIENDNTLGRGIISVDLYMLTRDSENRIDVTLNQQDTNIPQTFSFSLPDPDQVVNPATGLVPMQTLTFNDRISRKLFRRTITLRNKAQD